MQQEVSEPEGLPELLEKSEHQVPMGQTEALELMVKLELKDQVVLLVHLG